MGWFSSGPKVLGFFDYNSGYLGRPERFVMYGDSALTWSVNTTLEKLSGSLADIAEEIDEYAVPGVEFELYASYHGAGWREVESTWDAKRGSERLGAFTVESAGVGKRLMKAWADGDLDRSWEGRQPNPIGVRLSSSSVWRESIQDLERLVRGR
jgi:hypothetical protein